MLPNPRVHSVGILGSGSAASSSAAGTNRHQSLEWRATRARTPDRCCALVALADLRDEPVVGRHAIDVKLPSSRECADDPLTRRADVDGKLVVTEEALRGSGHA